VDRTLDPKKQPMPSPSPGAQPSPETEDDPFNITDTQGVSHRGSVVVRACRTRELGCLDEGSGEEFRIVLLREPLAQGALTPECGVAVCAFHSAFSAAQEALPPDSTALAEEAQAQLAPGASESE